MKLTIEQVKGIYAKFQQNPDGAKDFAEFLDRVRPFIGDDSVIIDRWCGMVVGVETDGYTHT